MGTIEINATFRANQKPASFAKWGAETSVDFVFSVKGPQLVSHIKRLKNCETELANFFASGPLALGEKLGSLVWQLPPNLDFDLDVLDDFLTMLPKTIPDYLVSTGRADGRLKTEPFLNASKTGPIRHAIETRDSSFDDLEVDRLLVSHNIARVIADTPQNARRDLTADFTYYRLQGPAQKAQPKTTPKAISPPILPTGRRPSAAGLRRAETSLLISCTRNKVHALANAIALLQALGIVMPHD
ncbi:MAG: DUF72 domain-containing protein [Candidatus Devosia symbiotica]|nr:DUF72 domain-containing protein [Candidatus Devosia symbiotica]